MKSGLTTYHLHFGQKYLCAVKGKSGMTVAQVREQARLNAALDLEVEPGLLSMIQYANVEVMQ